MRYYAVRRALATLAVVAPIAAAGSTETAQPAAAKAFATEFAAFADLPTPPLSGSAVDVAAIAHSHPAGQEDVERGLGMGGASYYAAEFHGRRTASGERFDNGALTAAHRTLPFGSKVRVTNPANGTSVVVRINDRGPFTRGRLIDVSHAAAKRLGLIARGHAVVKLALLR